MKTEDIKLLLEDFYAGNTDIAQEELLLRYFKEEEVLEELLAEKELFLSMYDSEPIEIPAGLDSKLESLIDNLAKETIEKKEYNSKQLQWISIAAGIALLFSVGCFVNNSLRKDSPVVAQTGNSNEIKDPEIAYIEAQKALELVAVNFNKGISQLTVVSDNLNKTNEIIDKTLNKTKI